MLSKNLSNIKKKILENAENRTRGCWVRSKYATSVLCKKYFSVTHLLWRVRASITVPQSLIVILFPFHCGHNGRNWSSEFVFGDPRLSLLPAFEPICVAGKTDADFFRSPTLLCPLASSASEAARHRPKVSYRGTWKTLASLTLTVKRPNKEDPNDDSSNVFFYSHTLHFH